MPPAPPRRPLPHRSPSIAGRLLVALLCFAPGGARASYEDIKNMFQGLHGSTVFPVAGKTFDDIEETFGPRRQPSLDTVDPTKPYVAPQFFEDEDTTFLSHLLVPNSWLGGFLTGDYELTITASDIWLDSTTLTVSAIPEPSSWAALGGGLALGWAYWRRRGQRAG